MTVQKLKHGLLAAAIILGSGAALANDLSELGKSLTPVGAEKKAMPQAPFLNGLVVW